MQVHTAILLSHGGLLVGYGVLLLACLFVLHREAQRDSGGRTIIQIIRWQKICLALHTVLFSGAFMWILYIAIVFAHLVPYMDQICPTLIAPDDCLHAALTWRVICILLGEIALAAFIVIVYKIRKRTVSPPERAWPLAALTWSHILLVVSWQLCTPLNYPLEVSSLIGTRAWTRVSSGFAAGSITAYTFGTALWIIALFRAFYTCRHRLRNGSFDGALGVGETEEHVGQEDHELETLDPVVPVERV